MPSRTSGFRGREQTRFVSRYHRPFAFLSAVALAMLVGSPGTAIADDGRPQANPEERAAAMIRPAVMYLVAETYGWVRLPGGELLRHFPANSLKPFDAKWGCTAFVVNPDGWVATAGHCVDPAGAKELILQHASDDYIKEFPGSPEAQNPDEGLRWLLQNARVEGNTPDRGPETRIVVAYGTGNLVAGKLAVNVVDFKPSDKGDVALMKVEKHNMPSSELATDAEVDIGTPVLSVGFPGSFEKVVDFSLDPTNKSGKVSKKATSESIPQYEIDAAVTHGMSGGPTVKLDGKVIGVNSFGIPGESQPFNFIAPADGLAAIMAAKGIKPMLGPADVSYRKGLDNYYAGHYTDAIKDFDETLSMSPDYPGLADLKTDAVNLRQKYGDVPTTSASSHLVWYAVAGVVSVIAVAIAILVALLRRRRPAPAGVARIEPPIGPPITPVAPPQFQGVPQAPVGAGAPSFTAVAPSEESKGTEPHFCVSCGAEHHPAERFCPRCGVRISTGESV